MYRRDHPRGVQEKSRRGHNALLLFLCSVAGCAVGQSGPEGIGCQGPMWVQFNISCYAFIYVTRPMTLSLDLAQELCKDIGANMISIQTQKENTFLLQMFQSKWKGPKEVMLGMFYDADDNTLKWFDKSPVTFTNWKQERETDENLNTCGKMNTVSGEWEFVECDSFSEPATLCKTFLHLQENKSGQRVLMISLVMALLLIIPALLLFVIWQKRKTCSGFPSRHLPGASQVLPYSEDDLLVDTIEGEAWA